MTQPIVSTEEVQKLLAGSFEELSVRVENCVRDSAQRVFGEDGGRVKVIGTFGGHAIVVNDKAKFVKVMYEVANNGEYMIVGVEKIDVPVYDTAEKVRGFLRKEAGSVVESFYHGDYENVGTRITEMMRTMGGIDAEIVSTMIEASQAPRLWKVKLGVKSLAESFKVPEFTPKFAKITSGAVAQDQLEGYGPLLAADLKELATRMSKIGGTVEESFATLTSLIDTHPELAKEEAVSGIQAFMKDLMDDLMEAQTSVSEALQNVHSITALSELHDALAEGLNRQEIAGRYISLAVANLASAHEK